MSLPDALLELMHDNVTLEPQTGTDKNNNFTYGTPVSVQCYIMRTNVRALSREGRELISTVQVILGSPELAVSANDRLTLPDGTCPAIIQVIGAPDENGDPYLLELRA